MDLKNTQNRPLKKSDRKMGLFTRQDLDFRAQNIQFWTVRKLQKSFELFSAKSK